MNPLVVGLSYRTAPFELLEAAALEESACTDFEKRLCAEEHIGEAVVLSTCNRLEIYTAVGRFHSALATIGELLHDQVGRPLDLTMNELTEHLYVHYEAAAVGHLFSVATGLDSMAVGEQQIIGQVRAALRRADSGGTVGPELHSLLQSSLRVGKRAHAETDLDRVGVSLVEAGLARTHQVVGDLAGAHALVIGAGAMSGLAAATLRRAGVGELTVISRTYERAERLAGETGTARPMDELAGALAEADLVISCTGARGHVVLPPMAAAAAATRGAAKQVYLDLALPRDVHPEVADVEGVLLIDLEALGRATPGVVAAQLAAALDEAAAGGHVPDGATTAEPGAEGAAAVVRQAKELISGEVHRYLAERSASTDIAPTVVALRGMASSVVDSELTRMRSRLAGRADSTVLREVEQTVHRVVEKLLHTPTVRVKQLATEPNGGVYAQALRELFDLDPAQVDAVTAVIEPGRSAR